MRDMTFNKFILELRYFRFYQRHCWGLEVLGWEAVSLSENFPTLRLDHSLKRQNQSSLSWVVEDSSFLRCETLFERIFPNFSKDHTGFNFRAMHPYLARLDPEDEGAVILQKAEKFRVMMRHPTQKTWTCFGKIKFFIGLRFGNGIGKVELF